MRGEYDCGNHVGLFIKPHGKMTYPPDEVSRVAVAKGVGVKIGLLPSVSPSFRMPPEHPRCFSAICQNSLLHPNRFCAIISMFCGC